MPQSVLDKARQRLFGLLGAVDATDDEHRSGASSGPNADGGSTSSAWHRRWQDQRVFRVNSCKFSHHSTSARLQVKPTAHRAALLDHQANVFVGIADHFAKDRTDMFAPL